MVSRPLWRNYVAISGVVMFHCCPFIIRSSLFPQAILQQPTDFMPKSASDEGF